MYALNPDQRKRQKMVLQLNNQRATRQIADSRNARQTLNSKNKSFLNITHDPTSKKKLKNNNHFSSSRSNNSNNESIGNNIERTEDELITPDSISSEIENKIMRFSMNLTMKTIVKKIILNLPMKPIVQLWKF